MKIILGFVTAFATVASGAPVTKANGPYQLTASDDVEIPRVERLYYAGGKIFTVEEKRGAPELEKAWCYLKGEGQSVHFKKGQKIDFKITLAPQNGPIRTSHLAFELLDEKGNTCLTGNCFLDRDKEETGDWTFDLEEMKLAWKYHFDFAKK